eukprot:CAMPEP_0175039770 /NCGR_PEP_ID=MMETSP0052_2-20121109/823_1 /TAXON_ID=51329 ORGANISM="Polytomella parva, Strain SAG 63-3" /NCGR_SAMPLE_ID=MMETSP0052_2 /ASSEMBLY_ACC=CAM_ASM_000194 /LENGTH=70 /DNA_ID=CAMNT_0016301769 /DNA_START=117 /DNA_END=329 /DNA_ORIENTATION=+
MTHVPIREIVYQLSPYQMNVVKNMAFNAPATGITWIKEHGTTLAVFLATFYGATGYIKSEMKKEVLAQRF